MSAPSSSTMSTGELKVPAMLTYFILEPGRSHHRRSVITPARHSVAPTHVEVQGQLEQDTSLSMEELDKYMASVTCPEMMADVKDKVLWLQ